VQVSGNQGRPQLPSTARHDDFVRETVSRGISDKLEMSESATSAPPPAAKNRQLPLPGRLLAAPVAGSFGLWNGPIVLLDFEALNTTIPAPHVSGG